ncbi:hypothetical protein Tco_0876174 [Tanacetum coccineum]|uniref:Maturase K n=1 Tax=Tanacetum coccineum TaxID=301880 RepID=A0ABQ5BT25_9ASTR
MVFEKYGYNNLREIIFRRADYQEYKISEKDFKNLHPNDFEDLFLLNIQEKLNHLPKTDKTSLHTAVNMWIRNLVAVSSSLRLLEPKCTVESRAKRSSINPNIQVKRWFFTMKMEILLEPTSNKPGYLKDGNRDGNSKPSISSGITEMLMNTTYLVMSNERPHKGVKASANSDIMYFSQVHKWHP